MSAVHRGQGSDASQSFWRYPSDSSNTIKVLVSAQNMIKPVVEHDRRKHCSSDDEWFGLRSIIEKKKGEVFPL